MEIFRTHQGDPIIVEKGVPQNQPTKTITQNKATEEPKVEKDIEKKLEEKKPIEKPIESISFDGKSIEFITKKLAEERSKDQSNPDRVYLLEHILFNRIKNLTMNDQMKLMKSSAQKFPVTSPVYKTIRDNVLLNLMDKFVEKKYRQALTSTPKSVEVSHLEDVQKFVNQLSADQVEMFEKINREYNPPLNPNSPEYDYFREAHKSIQATIDQSIDARAPGNNIYEDLQDDMDQNSFANQLEEQIEENNTVDIYQVFTPEQVEIAQELAEEIKEETGDEYQIVLVDEVVMDSYVEDQTIDNTNEMENDYVMEKVYTGTGDNN